MTLEGTVLEDPPACAAARSPRGAYWVAVVLATPPAADRQRAVEDLQFDF